MLYVCLQNMIAWYHTAAWVREAVSIWPLCQYILIWKTQFLTSYTSIIHFREWYNWSVMIWWSTLNITCLSEWPVAIEDVGFLNIALYKWPGLPFKISSIGKKEWKESNCIISKHFLRLYFTVDGCSFSDFHCSTSTFFFFFCICLQDWVMSCNTDGRKSVSMKDPFL